MIQAHLIISGEVQGVCFRAWAKDMATQLGLKGFVRNCSDGAVEAVFEGKEDAVKKAVELCRKGPSGAAVTDVKVEFKKAKGEFSGFEVRY